MMVNELILWGALAVLIALMALAVWAGRRGLHALGVVGPDTKRVSDTAALADLVAELGRLNTNLERLLEDKGSATGDYAVRAKDDRERHDG